MRCLVLGNTVSGIIGSLLESSSSLMNRHTGVVTITTSKSGVLRARVHRASSSVRPWGLTPPLQCPQCWSVRSLKPVGKSNPTIDSPTIALACTTPQCTYTFTGSKPDQSTVVDGKGPHFVWFSTDA